jgi:hypothetical protein
MKPQWLAAGLLLLAPPLYATHSILFSTNLNGVEGYAWKLSRVDSAWVLSFPNDAMIVDGSSPADTYLENDLVVLPDFILSDISTHTTSGGLIATATLTPDGPMSIVDSGRMWTVMTAILPSGGLVTFGPTFLAFALSGNDLTIIGHDASYGTVIPGLFSDQENGFRLDFSFSGNDPTTDLAALLMGQTGTAQGGLSGQIHAVAPTPGAVLLAGAGLCLVGWLRKRSMF